MLSSRRTRVFPPRLHRMKAESFTRSGLSSTASHCPIILSAQFLRYSGSAQNAGSSLAIGMGTTSRGGRKRERSKATGTKFGRVSKETTTTPSSHKTERGEEPRNEKKKKKKRTEKDPPGAASTWDRLELSCPNWSTRCSSVAKRASLMRQALKF